MGRSRYDWEEEVATWRASGQSMARFASGRGYSRSSLEKWARELRELRARGSAAAPGLARVEIIASGGGLVVEVGSARIRVSVGFDGGLLRQVVAALESAS